VNLGVVEIPRYGKGYIQIKLVVRMHGKFSTSGRRRRRRKKGAFRGSSTWTNPAFWPMGTHRGIRSGTWINPSFWPMRIHRGISLERERGKWASQFRGAPESTEIVEEIYRLLPKVNCGSCGYSGCYECAVAISRGEAPPDACVIIGRQIEGRIREIIQSKR